MLFFKINDEFYEIIKFRIIIYNLLSNNILNILGLNKN